MYVECPLEALVERDPKGLYKKAIAGEIKGFTGVDDPYEEPEAPEIVVHTATESIDESTHVILGYLEANGFLTPSEEGRAVSSAPTELVNRIVAHPENLPSPDGPTVTLSSALL